MATDAEIVRQIAGKRDFSVPPMSAIGLWMGTNENFRRFVTKYQGKIRAKLEGAKEEQDLVDILWELELAHLLLKDSSVAVEYEPYGSGASRAPDFCVTRKSLQLNLEARRIRTPALESRFEVWEQRMADAIRAVPSDVGVSLTIPGMQPKGALFDLLERKQGEIQSEIASLISSANQALGLNESVDHVIEEEEGGLQITITKPSKKAAPGETSYYGGSFPVWFSNREFAKFGDIICDKLGQLRPGMPNLIVVHAGSACFNGSDCEDAVTELSILGKQGNEKFFIKKGFRGSQDFFDHTKRLSGVVFRSNWIGPNDRNFFWRNTHSECGIDSELAKFFAQLD